MELQTAKLLNLASLLRIDAADPKGIKFDLRFVIRTASTLGRDCGTSGCAIGLACVSEEFPELMPADDRFIILNGFMTRWDTGAKEFFGLNDEQVEYLFNDHSYPPELRQGSRSELAVAKRIEDLVANNGAF